MPGPGLLSQFFVWANSHHTADTGNISGHPKPGQTQNPLQPTERREWLHVDAEGNLKHIAVDKHALVVELGVPYRDLRMLDPLIPIPYPSSLFIREKALVVNLETVRMLICKNQVYVLSVPANNSLNVGAAPAFDSPFVQELVLRIRVGQVNKDGTPLHRESINLHLDRYLPFELRALECALSTVTRILSRECADIETEAAAPLERILHLVNRRDLETVRNVKSYMNKLQVRVKKIKTELERILDDDTDMADMYLGRREEQEAAELAALQHQDSIPRAGSAPTLPRAGSLQEAYLRRQMQDNLLRGERPSQPIPISEELEDHEPAHQPASQQPGSMESGTEEVLRKLEELHRHTAKTVAGQIDPHDIEACEALLESYFMQVDFLYSGLLQLKERIDDTEDLINIELDHRRNELVSLDLMVTIITAAFAFMAMIAGIFGMNLDPLPISETQLAFWLVIGVGTGISVAMFVLIFSYARYKGLLFLTTPVGLQVSHFEKGNLGGLDLQREAATQYR